jgi:hypothetical protein
MHRTFSDDDPPWDCCKCGILGVGAHVVLKHFLSNPALLRDMRMPHMSQEEFKAILCSDYVNHVDAGDGVYVLGTQQMCKSCYMWLRGVISPEPLKQASLTVRKGWPIKRHGRIGKTGILSQKKLDALGWFLREVELWGERMPGATMSGKLYVPFYVDKYELYCDYREACGPGVYDENGRLQILGARSFIDMIKGRGPSGKYCKHVQFTKAAAFKKCGECEMYKTQIGALRKAGFRFESQEVQAVVFSRRAHITIVSSDRGLFLWARRLYQGPSPLIPDEWVATLLISGDKSSDVFHPERFVQTDAITKLPQLKGLFFGIMNHSACENVAILSPASGVERVVRDDDAAKVRRKQRKKNGGAGEVAAPARAKKGQAKMKVSVSWKGGTIFASFLLTYISQLQKTGAKLPRHLYLQIDGGERSYVLLCLCAYWLAIGTFDRVTIASHFPGHTHEAVDAMFSELRRALKAHSDSGTLTWEEILTIAQKTFQVNTTAKHGPVHVVEPDCVFDLDKYFEGVRSPKLKGLWGEKNKVQTEKPHVYELCVRIVDSVRVPEVRSFVCASNKADDELIRDWAQVFIPFANLPPPTNLPVLDFHAPFERNRNEMVRVMRSSAVGSLGLSDAQIQHYENLKLVPLQIEPSPFGIQVLPSCAAERKPAPAAVVAPQPQGRQQRGARQQDAAVRAQGAKRKGREDFAEESEEESGEQGEDEQDEDDREEEGEENEEDDNGEDHEDNNSQIVNLLEMAGNGRVLAQFGNGRKKIVHRDELPDKLENAYKKLVKESQKRARQAEKDVLYNVWHQQVGAQPRQNRRK